MLLERNVLLSVKAFIQSLLESTDKGLDNGFNVYTEENMRHEDSVTAPYLYLIHTHIFPTEDILPFVAVEIVEGRPAFIEMGSKNGKQWDINIHIYAKSRGQRDDLATYLADPAVFTDVPIKNYNNTPATSVETAKVLFEYTRNRLANPTEDEEFQGDWRYRRIVSHTILTVS